MSTMTFDGQTHQITLRNRAGAVTGTWPAFNNIDRHATLNHLPDGTYAFQDTIRPHPHPASPNGPYGSYGILRFNVPGHVGIGVHSGRADSAHLPGPQHPTEGCIRTTDAGMAAIAAAIRTDPLSTISVQNNSRIAAEHAAIRLHHHAR
jgi:hypothetical protein